jgi:hypothetical protein
MNSIFPSARARDWLPPFAGLSLVAAFAACAAERNATPEEALTTLSNATIDYSRGGHHFYEYYSDDGVAHAGDGRGNGWMPGRWNVRSDGTVCFLHDDPNQSGCVFVRASGSAIEFHRIDGVVEGPFKLARGNPHGL